MPKFTEVKAQEQAEVDNARDLRGQKFTIPREKEPPKPGTDRVGIAFSGGGIRSATFNLGILQGLARFNLLQRVDYISTVSGGGFIGSWLITWIKRSGLPEVIKGLASSPASPPIIEHSPPPTPPPPPGLMKPAEPPPPGESYRESKPLNFLRDYSNYLTPRVGLFSADVWAAIALYLRNLLLNLTILILFLSGILLLPRVWEAFFLNIGSWASDLLNHAAKTELAYAPLHLVVVRLVDIAGVLLLIAITAASWNLASISAPRLFRSRFTKQGWVIGLVVAPIFLAAPLATIALWLDSANLKCISWGKWAFWGAVVYGLLRLAGLMSSLFASELMTTTASENPGWLIGCAFAAGPLGGVLVGWTVRLFDEWAPLAKGCPSPTTYGVARVACWGTPLLVSALLLTGVLHIGLMSLKFNNQKREWWARMTGWVLIFCLSGAFVFGFGIYAPLGVQLLSGYLKTALGGGWILSTLGGLLAGKSGATSGKSGGNAPLEIVARFAPYVFVVGLLCLLSFGIHRAITPSGHTGKSDTNVTESGKVTGDVQLAARKDEGSASNTLTDLKLTFSSKPQNDSKRIKEQFWKEVLSSTEFALALACWHLRGWGALFTLALILVGAAALLSCRVDINEFSMQLLYRNRLVRCYLGASNEKRKPQPFSGFDPEDDTLLSEFLAKNGYGGPYPILNCTLSVTHGERLAWQERKGESFVFTPKYSGYEYQEQYSILGGMVGESIEDDEEQKKAFRIGDPNTLEKVRVHDTKPKVKEPDGFCETATYAYPKGGVYLGTALATSGAAANPNMGFHTSPPLAFLMTVFNVRLGWWFGNPQNPSTRQKAAPTLGLAYLLKELFALTDARSGFVNLSDGFHFENLGLYELVRRHCKYIVVGDAGADPQHSFDDLGNAIRKCRTDFGVEIEIDLEPLELQKDATSSQSHSAAGKIRYDLVDPSLGQGVLLYLKPSLTGNDPVDVQNYKTLHPGFPHQPTANQWFDESQFESYRQLGRVSAEATLERVGTPDVLAGMTTSEIFSRIS